MDNDLNNLRHSTSHLLASAVMDLFPSAKPAIGPPIENGFYYDFDFGNIKISESDFIKIEDKMHQIKNEWKEFKKYKLSNEEAKKEFSNNSYKLELIDEIIRDKEAITVYQSGNFRDLCKGGHVINPSEEIKYFKLLSVAGAYWRGNEKIKCLLVFTGSFPYKN